MAQQNTGKSQSLTYLDQTPPFQLGPNLGPGEMRSVVGSYLAVAGDQAGTYTAAGGGTASVYKMVRVPSIAKIKNVWLDSAVTVAGNADINIVWSDSTADGTSVTNQSTVPQISSANNKLFGSAMNLVSIGRSTATVEGSNLTFANTTNFPMGPATNAAITAAISAGNAGYPASGTLLTTESQNTPLWQMLGLGNPTQGDIGGWFDFVLTLTTAIGASGGGYVQLQVDYVV